MIQPDNPIATGLDYTIDRVKNLLAELNFVDESYGRIFELRENNGDIIPVVHYDTSKGYKPLVPDGKAKSFIGIFPLGDVKVSGDFSYQTQNYMNTLVEIIFFGDIEKIFTTKEGRDNINSNLLASLTVNKLKELEENFELESITEQKPRVYSSFKFNTDSRYYFYPYVLFKIVGKLHFDENAGEGAGPYEPDLENGIKIMRIC